MIIDLQRRIQEAGRIRIGQQVQAAGGKTRPAKLDTFRLTSADRKRVDQAARLYGGTPAEWQAPAGKQWQVITTADSLPVIVPPSEMAFSQWYELWAAGGCQRRCDGVTESIGDQPCPCDPDQRECAIHTRLSVMLRDLPGLGVWRIDTSGYYAAVELSGAVQVIQAAAGRGTMLPARLRLEQRTVKRPDAQGKPQTRNFAVPVLDVEISPAQLMAGSTPAPVESGGGQPAISSPLTPVPADLPEGPQRTIAQQSAPPEPKAKRKNSATEIPSSGRTRRRSAQQEPQQVETATEYYQRQPAREDETEANDAEPMITPAQEKKLGAVFSQLGMRDRDQAVHTASVVVGRPLDTRKELTKEEASTLIDTLEFAANSDDPAGNLASLVERVEDAEVVDDGQTAAETEAGQ
ncbi:MAG: hypothetical protein ACRDQA_00315 [Nocardioidaceae bacterium]